MAASQGRATAADRSAEVARRLEQSWVGPEHVLLALFDEPSAATEALEELGVTRERVEEHARATGHGDPPPRPHDPSRGQSPNPAWYKLTGCANGLALAAGRQRPDPEHYLLALVYAGHTVAPLLHGLGASQQALLDALARRGVRVPAVDPPEHRPLRGYHQIEVTQAELRPVIDVLIERHPPGSEWRWGFNWLPGDPVEGQPRRASVGAEEDVDLDAALATARERATAGE
jgi:ATP-dependent Clp protease ATP-binding subunit ClpA